MKTFLAKLWLIWLAVLSGSCALAQFSALSHLQEMKAIDYFPNPRDAALAHAAGHGDLKGMRKSLVGGANPNAVGKEGITPLFWTLAKRNIAGFKYLLENGADPNYRTGRSGGSQREVSIMQISAIAENPDYLALALRHGGNPNQVHGREERTIIFDAIENGRVKNVKALIASGADLNFTNAMRETPVKIAALVKEFEIVYVLLEAGADPFVKNRWGSDLIDGIDTFGAKGVSKNSSQYIWYQKVRERLRMN